MDIFMRIYRMPVTTHSGWCFSLAVLLSTSIPACAEDAILRVTGEIKIPLKLTLKEVKDLPSAKLSAKDHDGTTARYEGVPLHEILRRAGVAQGESLRSE